MNDIEGENLVKQICLEEMKDLSKKGSVLIDVRSPSEYDIDTIPGAVNIPILDDREREKVGTCYKQKGSGEARILGLNLISSRLPDMINKIVETSSEKPPIIFCWRGGMRSKSVVTLLDLMGISAYQLIGGYKAYRKSVNSFFESRDVLPAKFCVLHGLTGVGKTDILKELNSLGENVIDLEGLANNRGSAFGSVGLGSQPSQKAFETGLYKILNENLNEFFFTECESRRIGKLIIPESMFKAMNRGKRILIYDSLNNRTKRIVNEYSSSKEKNIKELSNAIKRLKQKLGGKKVEELIYQLHLDNYDYVVKYLLENYYDPRYGYPDKPHPEYELSLKNEDSRQTAVKIRDFINLKEG